MKPLELCHRFEDRNGETWWVWNETCVKAWIADDFSARKRLTAPELAAEYHANECEAWQMSGRIREHYNVDRAEEIELRSDTLRRFARLPHYDEVTQ